MEFQVEREIGGSWYTVKARVKGASHLQAVAFSALGEGRYRARRLGYSKSRHEFFVVPAWGPPIPLGPAE